MLVDLDRPCTNGTKYKLKPIKGNFVMVNLEGNDNLPDDCPDFENIENLDAILISNTNVNIYYPAYEKYFLSKYSSGSGFTLKQILQLINKTGYDFHYFDYQQNPTYYYNVLDANDAASSVGEYAVSKFYIDVNNIYVEVDH